MTFRHFNGKQIDFLLALREAGATTAETAVTVDSNTSISPAELEELVEVGAIARVAPYRYRLCPESRHAKLIAAMESRDTTPEDQVLSNRVPRSPGQMAKTALFWIILILIPLMLMQLFRTDR
jgi:hypothetical protein